MPRAVILTALPVEYLAVRTHLTEIREEMHPQGTIYERGKFIANGQEWEVGIAEVGAGNAGAAVEAERAIAYFKPDILFFVGIAGGIKDVAIGDVVAATEVYGYESGKVGEQFFTRPALGQSAYALVQRAKAEARNEEWLQRLFNSSTSQPRVFVAPIAAGEKVVASKESDVLNFIRGSYNDAIAVEMEGFGFLSAAFAYPNIKAIVIRGISDLIQDKNAADPIHGNEKERQERASHNVSAFAFEMLAKLKINGMDPQGKSRSVFRPKGWGMNPKRFSDKVEPTASVETTSKQFDIEEMISEIRSGDPLIAANAVQFLRDRPDLMPRILDFDTGISPVSMEAVRTLFRDYPEQSGELLLDRVNQAHTNWSLGVKAATCFDRVHEPYCVDELVRNLGPGIYRDIKQISIDALGRCGGIGWGLQLRKILDSPINQEEENDEFGWYVVNALARLFSRSTNELDISYASEHLLQELIQQSQSRKKYANYSSLTDILKDPCNAKHGDAFIGWLASEPSKIASTAAFLLGWHKVMRAVKPLIKRIENCLIVDLTESERSFIREASSALGRIGTSAALEYLLSTPESSIERYGLVFSMEEITDLSLFHEVVRELLTSEHHNRNHRYNRDHHFIFRAIGRRRDQESHPELLVALEGSEPVERGASALALARLKYPLNQNDLRRALDQSNSTVEGTLIRLAILTIDPSSYRDLEDQLRRDLSKDSYMYDEYITTDIIEVLVGTEEPDAVKLAEAWKPFYQGAKLV
ncbi:hypothetical protein JOY44_20425 [Phormidium sp. CLA17]|uniref:phosphorylase family protein n=1 Tax=Leptolyngbya sp. Cla-17 TaxID=2803751 RepID=UPI001491CD1C|nr:hypothetical protein [Leptolyngbya sp. Cla-17]MBM0743958.1 hypothetical protein [Leptolyngbya sp. Cla-17]